MSREPVTLLMPVKNGFDFLPSALNGLRECAEAFDDILIIDDGSSDGSSELIQEWIIGQNNAAMRVNPGHGLVDALNYGISLASTNWIARFDVDDVYDCSRIKLQFQLLSDSTVAVFSDYQNITISGANLGLIRSAVLTGLTEFSVISGQRLAHPSVIFSKPAVIQCGMYKSEDFPAEDLGLWLRLMQVGSFVSCPDPVLHYRITGNSVTSQKTIEMQNMRKQLLVQNQDLLKNIVAKLPNYPLGIYLCYKGINHSRERRLLFYRDMLNAWKLGIISNSRLLLVLGSLTLEVISPQTWIILIRLRIEKSKRKKFR